MNVIFSHTADFLSVDSRYIAIIFFNGPRYQDLCVFFWKSWKKIWNNIIFMSVRSAKPLRLYLPYQGYSVEDGPPLFSTPTLTRGGGISINLRSYKGSPLYSRPQAGKFWDFWSRSTFGNVDFHHKNEFLTGEIPKFSACGGHTSIQLHFPCVSQCIHCISENFVPQLSKIKFYFCVSMARSCSETLKNGVYFCRSRPQAGKKSGFCRNLWKWPPLVRVGVENKGGASSTEYPWSRKLFPHPLLFSFSYP